MFVTSSLAEVYRSSVLAVGSKLSKKRLLLELEIASTEHLNDSALCGNTLKYDFIKEGRCVSGGIKFNLVKAKRTRSEGSCIAWHVDGVYDRLVEVCESEWVQEIMKDTQDRQQRLGQVWNLCHYMIYLDGLGCVEVIATSYSVLPEEPCREFSES